MGRRTAKDTAELIEAVARGERRLEEIEDPALRETVRLALRLVRDSAPDAATRNRIRSRVFGQFKPRPMSLGDRVALSFELLAKPAPIAMRALGVGLAIVCLGAGSSVASVASTPSDFLYPVKRASEQVRLALAVTPEDRAGVQLSIAEHRLAEAAALASRGDDLDAVVLTSQYGAHLANAAAELAQTDVAGPSAGTLVAQLQLRVDAQRATAAAAVAQLANNPGVADATAALAAVASRPDTPSGLSAAAAIAQQAANTTDAIATAAERRAAPARPTVTTTGNDTPATTGGAPTSTDASVPAGTADSAPAAIADGSTTPGADSASPQKADGSSRGDQSKGGTAGDAKGASPADPKGGTSAGNRGDATAGGGGDARGGSRGGGSGDSRGGSSGDSRGNGGGDGRGGSGGDGKAKDSKERAAEETRKSADEAKAAAEKAKEGSNKDSSGKGKSK